MPQKNKRLEQLRSQLQIKLKAKRFFEEQVAPFVEILSHLQGANTHFEILDFVGLDEHCFPYLKEELKNFPYTILDEGVGKSPAIVQLHQVFETFPSTHPLRYVPPFSKLDVSETPETGLKEALHSLDEDNQNVSIYYLQYAPLIKLNLDDLALLANEHLFNFWHGDVVIFPDNLSWLIAYSLEEDWYAGRRDDIISASS